MKELRTLEKNLMGFWTIENLQEIKDKIDYLMLRSQSTATADYVEYKLSEVETRLTAQIGKLILIEVLNWSFTLLNIITYRDKTNEIENLI